MGWRSLSLSLPTPPAPAPVPAREVLSQGIYGAHRKKLPTSERLLLEIVDETAILLLWSGISLFPQVDNGLIEKKSSSVPFSEMKGPKIPALFSFYSSDNRT